MAGNVKFSRSVFKTLILFVGSCLALIIGILYFILTTSMTNQFRNKLQVEVAEISIILTDRFNSLQDNIQEMGYSNSIRVSLMLGLYNQLDEIITTRFPVERGAYYAVHEVKTGKIIPEQPKTVENLLTMFMSDQGKLKMQTAYFYQSSVDQVWSVISVPIRRKDQTLGTAFVAYNLTEDATLWKRLQSKSSDRLLYVQGSTVTDLRTGETQLFTETGGEDQKILPLLEEVYPDREILLLQQYPGVQLLASRDSLHNEKKSLFALLMLLCLLVFFLTVIVSLFIARMVSSPLEDMADRAMAIARNPTGLEFTGRGLQHLEFAKLAEAFNGVLTSLIESRENLSKRAEQLDKSERQYRLLAENSSEIIISYNLEGGVTYINEQGLKIGGYSREIVDTLTIGDLLVLNDEKKSGYFETDFYLQNNETISVEAQIAPLIQDKGVEGWLATIRDVTEKKRLENQLQQARKIEALGVLAGGIAHDFNNIIYTIYGNTEMAMEEIDKDSEAYDDLETVLKASNRAKELVRQILTFSRRNETRKEPIQIQSVVGETLKLMRASIPANIEIVQRIDKNCSTILANPTQIHQVVMNLCANSSHAMEEKGGCLTVEVTERLTEHLSLGKDAGISASWVMLRVSDNGVGIPEAIMDQIFDPYFTTKPKGKGTGLGLATVHGIVKSMDGEIDVNSSPGNGTIVTVLFRPVPQSMAAGKKDAQKDLQRGSNCILVVDDDLEILQMVEKILERQGYTVKACNGSIEALELFSKKHKEIDLMVSDMLMPRMTGLQLSMEVRKIRSDLPIVLCTGHSEVLENADTSGVCDVLRKPLSKQELLKAIQENLKNQRELVS